MQGDFSTIFNTLEFEYGVYEERIIINDFSTSTNIDIDDEYSCTIDFEPIAGTDYRNWNIDIYIPLDFWFSPNSFNFYLSNGSLKVNYDI